MIGCLSLARETNDIDFAKKKLAKTKKLISNFDKNIIFFNDLITNDKIGEGAIKYYENNKCSKFIVFQSTFTDAKFISAFCTPGVCFKAASIFPTQLAHPAPSITNCRCVTSALIVLSFFPIFRRLVF